MSEGMEKHIQKMPLDDIVKVCIYHINKDILNRKETPALFYEFRDHLRKAIISVPDPSEGGSPMPQLFFMLEDFTQGVSRLIVSISSITPTILGKAAGLSEDQVSLIRRGVEDHMIGLVEQMLRKLVLDDHIEYDNFRSTKEGS
ncbi:hypothetical protein LCGC14_2216080 [marine sediment metagenome]|uniref:Uncharacterized protein n=1 Tax=marine sediment metagenome TaxID=412755 RepID=A0A0F9DCC1_9ZZZZ